MDDLDKFIALAGEWHPVRDAMREAQLELDLKCVSFLQGKGPPPIRKELEHVFDLRFLESRKRQEMDKLIAKLTD